MRLQRGSFDDTVAKFACLIILQIVGLHRADANLRSSVSSSTLLSDIQYMRIQCESYELWTPGLQAEQRTIDDKVRSCLSQLDALNLALPTAEQPSVSQKKEILIELESFLRLIRYFSNNLRIEVAEAESPKVGISLSQMIALEQSTRLAISLVNSFETWEGNVRFSVGTHNRASKVRYLAGAAVSLRIDLGQNIEGFTEIQTATPRKEEDSTVELPPNSSDLLTVSQMWVKTRRIKRLHFMLGVMPEFEDELAPERWPFLTLGTQINVFTGFDWTSFLLFRHDTYGIWDYSSNSYKPSRIERNLTSLDWTYAPYLSANDEIQLKARFQLHWYSDPNGTLTRLSLGRYDNLQPSRYEPVNYRLAKIDQNTKAQFKKNFLFENYSTVFWNLDSQRYKAGRYVSIATSYKARGWAVGPKIYAADIECLSIPPVGLNNQLFPNTRSRGASLNFTKRLWEKTSLSVQILAQRNTTKSFQDSCPLALADTLNTHSISEKYILSVDHSFSPDTQL